MRLSFTLTLVLASFALAGCGSAAKMERSAELPPSGNAAPQAHAAAYAFVAYQTAYLKANYTVEFLSAMMTNDMGDTAKLSQYIAEARTMGIEVLPPDVNEPGNTERGMLSKVRLAPALTGTICARTPRSIPSGC